MDSSKLVLLLSLLYILLLQPSLTAAQPNFTHYNCSYNFFSNYTTDSNFHRNLNSVLSSIASDTQIDYGFYNPSAGEFPDRVNAFALCRGDVAVDVCRSCVDNSTRKILEVCPNTMNVFGIYELCMIRYSNSSMFGVVDDHYFYYNWKGQKVLDVTLFNQALDTLFDRLLARAASGNSLKKFASGNQSAGVETVYATVQCTPYLSEGQCSGCLLKLLREIPNSCNGSVEGKTGATLTNPSCNLRWDIVKKFSGTLEILSPPPQILSPTTLPAPSQGKKSNTTIHIIVITVVPTVGVMILVICICLFIRTRKQREKERVEIANKIESAESLQFAFSTIEDATEDFTEKNRLGQGGFGVVYKGVLPNGQEIAVKRLSKDSGQGDLEFKNEVLLVAKLQHRNLVKLLGFCLEGIERLLIYEFVPNSSLAHFIFDPTKHVQLNWERRYNIIRGIARGLLYLHEDSRLRIIHRDLKASNILLDEEMNPKISDFGMARLFVVDQTQGSTSRIVGTYGYMAPEYALQGHFSVKLDIFSFGVIVLEILTSKKNSFHNGDHIEHLLSHAWRNWREGTAHDIIDPVLSSGSAIEMKRCIHIGLLCVQENAADRPTMASVVLMLSNSSLTLQIPSQPAFLMSNQSDMSFSLGQNSRVCVLLEFDDSVCGAVGTGPSSGQEHPIGGAGRMVRTRQGTRTEPPSFERRGGNQGAQGWQDEDPLDDTESHALMILPKTLQGEAGVAGEDGSLKQTEGVPPVAAEQQERSEAQPSAIPIGVPPQYVDAGLLVQIVKAVMEGMEGSATRTTPTTQMPQVTPMTNMTMDNVVPLVRLVKSLREMGCEPYIGNMMQK
ncbi:hypothetical protein DKX38_017243 [Salix brachista]|uniref:Uncharacterized protein n=1 Tax=Salix brachista TaxID=2182728 RepID=A0A5N5KUR3_9ROSI|nr:hypothetical protein DKX38_017243 [Salix brachista]